MATASTLGFVGIAPHPPIMVPEVGREAIVEVRASIEGMAVLTQRVIHSGAETVVLISPHAPLEPSAFVAYDGPKLYADFANFRAPAITAQAELDEELLTEITKSAAAENLVVLRIQGERLDHGTAVPLYFLQRNGWAGKVIALGYTFLSNEDHLRFGKCIHDAIDKTGRPTALIASGDLSHRLKPDAPAGYNPQAHLFDEAVVNAVSNGSIDQIINIDQDLRRTAGECGYRSMLVALGAIGGLAKSTEVISYEAPFGVGYMVAQLHANQVSITAPSSSQTETGTSRDELTQIILALARQTIEVFISTGETIEQPDDLPMELSAHTGCFVSIKTRDGELRGCIGTIDPTTDILAEEIIANAISAATRDPRFPPVRKDELSNLKYSVDVLSSPEPAALEDLDPETYGVIVEDETGPKRGVLLPHLKGIQSPEQQVAIASRKAGILPGKGVKISRFRADRYSE